MAEARLNKRRLTGIAGLGAAILFGGGSALWGFEQPRAGASAGKLLAFYRDNDTEIVVGASLALVSIACFVFFASGVRAMLRDVEGDDLLGTAAFGGALAAAALRARAFMPRWAAVALVGVGVAFLTPLSRYLLGPVLLLQLAVSVQLLRRPRT
jgi:hypothetical protein